jgi:hypothetical protein
VQPLYRLERKDRRCFTIRELFERSSEAEDSYIWKVLAAGEEMSLEQGDEIKIGKTKITFKELVTLGDAHCLPCTAAKDDTSRTVLPGPQELPAKDPEEACRVCF